MSNITDNSAYISSSLYEGINARYYRAREIAKSFVPNEQFERLLVRSHNLLVGPRGSGKTTLLRMLQPESLKIWNHPEAGRIRADIDFTGILISTDTVWRTQFDSVARRVGDATRVDFAHTILSLDAMVATIKAFRQRIMPVQENEHPFRNVELPAGDEAQLTKKLAEGWGLNPMLLDLESLTLDIRRKRLESLTLMHSVEGGSLSQLPLWWGFRWNDVILFGIDAFELVTKIYDERWAAMFDETEIAPTFIRDSIIHSTRGMDPRLMVKAALSPWLDEFAGVMTVSDGTAFNDFSVIELFYGKRESSYEFSRELLRSRLAREGREFSVDQNIEDVIFGTSRFAGSGGDRARRRASTYEEDGELGSVIHDLAEVDSEFRKWLDRIHINPKDVGSMDEVARAQTLRKARNVMIARLEFRKDSGQIRSRKTLSMYAGGATMLDICEGNPRLLLGILMPLLEFYDGVHPVPYALQSETLDKISKDFYALIDAIPLSPLESVPPELRGPRYRSPYRYFINTVAAFFRERTLIGPFNPQPPSTFRVPASASKGLQLVVGRLVNLGAIIVIPESGIKDQMFGEFDQQRMRLCYLIASREKLPPNVDRPISLLNVLKRGSQAQLQSFDVFESNLNELKDMRSGE
jgi:hypothetical protein